MSVKLTHFQFRDDEGEGLTRINKTWFITRSPGKTTNVRRHVGKEAGLLKFQKCFNYMWFAFAKHLSIMFYTYKTSNINPQDHKQTRKIIRWFAAHAQKELAV